MTKSACAVIALFAGVFMARSAITANSPDKTLQFATTDQRIAWYEGELRTSPDNPRLSAGLITVWLQKVRETADPRYLDLASRLVERMLDRDGGNLTFVRLLNEIDLQRHNFREVAARSGDLLRYNASDPGIWGNMGDAYMELGEYEQAHAAYVRMFELRPNLASYNRLGYWRFVTGDPEAAIVLMREAIDAGSDLPENVAWCWAELGDMYFKTGKLPQARDAYENAMKLFPSLHRAYAGFAKVQAAEGQVAAAIHSYQRAQAIVPMVEYAGALEDMYTLTGNSKEAAHQREMVNVISRIGRSRNEKTNRNLAIVLADHDRDLDAALNLVRAEIPERPDVYTYDALSWVLFKSGHLAEAAEASRRALRLGAPEPSFYYHAQAIAHARGDEAAALDCATRLVSLNAKFDILRSGLAASLPSPKK
jgi:tetratricopeptide (TPR) repeat protein